jgi:hypothetical protein
MNEPSTNQFFVVLLFILRCLVPLAILFGISYLLRKMGLVAVEAPEPPDENGDETGENASQVEAGTADLETSKAAPDDLNTVETKKESQQ